MPVYETTVTDRSNVPVAGAKGYIYVDGVLAELTDDLGAPLGNPITSDAFGYAKATVPNRDFTVKWSWLGAIRLIETYIEGGVDSTLRTDLAAATGAALIGKDGGGTVQDALGVEAKRLRILSRLQASLARIGGNFPKVMTSPPTIGAASADTTIATGTTWQLYDAGAVLEAGKFTLLGGVWGPIGSTFPQNNTARGRVSYTGTASVVEAAPAYGGRCRFSIEAPELELWVQTTAAGSGDGIRVKVNGEYIKTGVIANDGNGLYRYIKLTFGSRAMRNFELQFGGTAALVGVRAPVEYKPSPWPVPDALRGLVHGDSFVWTTVDSGDDDTALTGPLGVTLGELFGQPDTIPSGVGGSGWFAPSVKDRNYFNDRVNVDVVARAPDFIIEHGGGNDAAVSPTLAAMQAKVEEWLDAVLTAKPETIIFMTGPVIASAASAQHLTIRDAKQAAAAKYPKNVAFIDNLTDPWIFGTGRQGSTTGNGNRDWATGSDGAHPTMDGHQYLSQRIARAAGEAISDLIAANLA